PPHCQSDWPRPGGSAPDPPSPTAAQPQVRSRRSRRRGGLGKGLWRFRRRSSDLRAQGAPRETARTEKIRPPETRASVPRVRLTPHIRPTAFQIPCVESRGLRWLRGRDNEAGAARKVESESADS